MKIKTKVESYALFMRKYFELCELKNSIGRINKKRTSFRVTAEIRPTPSSNEYLVEFDYECNKYPVVWVYGLLSKEKLSGEIPHKYLCDTMKNRVEICLYRQKYKEYDKNVLFSKNIIPWTCEWLHFYELYLITGIWYGNGEHPMAQRAKDYD
ncbi:hypothetical protein [Lactiplantibacillus plantarum]|uniref:hypothetical protein n=1 Tax=Lactiplantibacillus plantarum TaxID=1590 RepID=UPI002413334D|nr:hypothetical protein [Lactiplantibacillus plantarum]